MDFDLLLDEASLAETTVPICLNGRLRGQYEAVKARIEERAAAQAATRPAGDDRLINKGPAPDPEQPELDRLVGKMRDHTVAFVLRALPEQEWADLFAAHPPRRDGQTGKLVPRDNFGINSSTFFPALVRRSVVSPEMTADRWVKLDKKLSDAQFNKLALAAWELNVREDDLPFSLGGSPDPLISGGS